MSWLSRFKNVLAPRHLDEDLAEEMRDHLERRAAELRNQGLDPTEARRRATIQFGNTTLIHERSRDFRLWSSLESALQDLRYAWRGMRKSPAVAATAIISLALAIGANTAIYSILDAALLRPLPVPQPNQLVRLTSPGIQQAGDSPDRDREFFSYPIYQDFRKGAWNSVQLALTSFVIRVEIAGRESGAGLEKANMAYVSGNAFEILRVPAALGRVLSPDDDRAPGASPVVVLSYDYWQHRYNGNPHVLGQTLRMGTYSSAGELAFQIVGVARKGFFGVEPGKFVDVWLPAMMYSKEAFTNPGWNWIRIVGRLAPSITPAQVQARLQPVFHQYQLSAIQRMPTMPSAIQAQFRNLTLEALPADAGVSGFRHDYARPLWIILTIAAGIFLIACANVASLLLARAIARSGEMAMRISLGASRLRLIRQLLTESLLLSLLAGTLGWVLARILAPLLVSLLSTEASPVRFALAINTRVLLFSALASGLAAIFFGLLPAWQSAGVQPMITLRGMAGQASKLRMGRFFVAVQVAFAFCLVVAGAAFLLSLWNLFSVNTGFDANNVVVLNVSESQPQKDVQRAEMKQLQRQLRFAPGVQSVAVAPWAIFEGSGWTEQVIVPGQSPSEREEIYYQVSPGYFATLRTPLLYGRDFDAHDSMTLDTIPAIVNLAFARRYLGGDDAVGRTFERPEGKKRMAQRVIGVVANAHYGSLRTGAGPIAYLPVDGRDDNHFTLYIRSPLDAGSVLHLVEKSARTAGPGLHVVQITALNTLVGNTVLKEKLLADIGGTFAFFGLLLAAIGLFGLLNYSVVRRTREIGIRAALGAQRGELVLLVLKDLSVTVGVGLAAGLLGSLAILIALKSLLFGLKLADPGVILIATVVFLAAGLMAAALPAGRAATVDPMIALRQE